MHEREAKEPIKIFLDENDEPFKVAHPPLRFSFSTIQLADGAHTLRVEASNGLAPPTIKEIPFRVRNGVAVTVSGLEPGQTIGGQVELIVNAYAGNTEVDFEPRRAETPQPIPTWAWVLLLGITAWTLFYIFNPVRPPRDASATTFSVGRSLGERLYMDTCARCHGEDGNGRLAEGGNGNYLVKKLRDTTNLAVAPAPYDLLFKVVTGVESPGGDIQMPAWGPTLTNEELVAVVNFIRSSWGHDASLIEPKYRRPPPGIGDLESSLREAMKDKSADELSTCCWPEGVRMRPPQLFRIDGPRHVRGKAEILEQWRSYFEALGKGQIEDFQLTDVRYAYEPEAIEDVKAYVFAMGRIFLSTITAQGRHESDTGRFIRVYRRVKRDDEVKLPGQQWALMFDFASIRMRVGCAAESAETDVDTGEPCPPEGTSGQDGEGTTPSEDGETIGYADVQALLAGLHRDPGDAPHGRFWKKPYKEFISLQFPFSWDDPDTTVPLLVVGDSKNSNIIKALSEERPSILVVMPDGTERHQTIARMPKGGKPMDPRDVARIAAWIDAGCPQERGGKEAAPKDVPPKDVPPKDVPPKDGPPKDVGPGESPKGGASKGGPAVTTGAIGYEEVQQLFVALGKDPGDAPHDRFWTLPFEKFVTLEFPFSWDDVDITVKFIEPYDSQDSNLIKALKDGKNITITLPGGRTTHRNIARMPKGGSPMSDAGIARIAAWIDAGCPEVAGGPPYFQRPGGADRGDGSAKDAVPGKSDGQAPGKSDGQAPEKSDGQAPEKSDGQAPEKPGGQAPEKPAASGLGFEDIRSMLRKLHLKAPNAPHGNFWKELSYEEFVNFTFPLAPGKPGRIRLLVPWDSAASNMLRAFDNGKGIQVRYPDGHVEVKTIAPMPKDADPIPYDVIAKIKAWIDAGCPEFAGKPSTLPKPGEGGAGKQPATSKPASGEGSEPAPASGGFPAPAPKK